jgi:hypothetical protein
VAVSSGSVVSRSFQVGLCELSSTSSSTPVFVTDLSETQQPVRIVDLERDPTGRIAYINDDRVLLVDPVSLEKWAVTPPEVEVVTGPAFAVVGDRKCVAYTAEESLPPATPYRNADGSAMDFGCFVRVVPVP